MPLCPLCRGDWPASEFRDSHIIPEFLYEPLYDESHTLMTVATDEPERAQKRHKGIYQRQFLCAGCETQTAKHEDYVAKRFRSGVTVEPDPDAIRLKDFDYRHLKLFQMGLLWKASASSRPEFRGIRLGPREEVLRAMVAADDPGAWFDFPCVLVRNDTLIERFGRELIVPGSMARDHDGQRVVQSYLGGLVWWFFVSGHAARSQRSAYFLREIGTLSIIQSKDPPWDWVTRLGQVRRP